MDTTEDPGHYDVGYRAHVAAREHLAAVWEASYAQEMADENGEDIEVPSPAAGPFDGCDECIIREVLAGAWPVLQEYYLGESVQDPASSA